MGPAAGLTGGVACSACLSRQCVVLLPERPGDDGTAAANIIGRTPRLSVAPLSSVKLTHYGDTLTPARPVPSVYCRNGRGSRAKYSSTALRAPFQ